MSVNYFKEEVKIDLRRFTSLKKWIEEVADTYNIQVKELNYIFCTDDYLLSINIEYLQHDTYTDIITFDNRENLNDPIEADIFISSERVEENAKIENIEFINELSRVMAHGLLHLIGFKDKTKEEKRLMREAEDKALSFL